MRCHAWKSLVWEQDPEARLTGARGDVLGLEEDDLGVGSYTFAGEGVREGDPWG